MGFVVVSRERSEDSPDDGPRNEVAVVTGKGFRLRPDSALDDVRAIERRGKPCPPGILRDLPVSAEDPARAAVRQRRFDHHVASVFSGVGEEIDTTAVFQRGRPRSHETGPGHKTFDARQVRSRSESWRLLGSAQVPLLVRGARTVPELQSCSVAGGRVGDIDTLCAVPLAVEALAMSTYRPMERTLPSDGNTHFCQSSPPQSQSRNGEPSVPACAATSMHRDDPRPTIMRPATSDDTVGDVPRPAATPAVTPVATLLSREAAVPGTAVLWAEDVPRAVAGPRADRSAPVLPGVGSLMADADPPGTPSKVRPSAETSPECAEGRACVPLLPDNARNAAAPSATTTSTQAATTGPDIRAFRSGSPSSGSPSSGPPHNSGARPGSTGLAPLNERPPARSRLVSSPGQPPGHTLPGRCSGTTPYSPSATRDPRTWPTAWRGAGSAPMVRSAPRARRARQSSRRPRSASLALGPATGAVDDDPGLGTLPNKSTAGSSSLAAGLVVRSTCVCPTFRSAAPQGLVPLLRRHRTSMARRPRRTAAIHARGACRP